jgi:hypothetical protein
MHRNYLSSRPCDDSSPDQSFESSFGRLRSAGENSREESKVAITPSSVERWGASRESIPRPLHPGNQPNKLNPLHRGRQSAVRQSAKKSKGNQPSFQIHFIVVGNQPCKDSSSLERPSLHNSLDSSIVLSGNQPGF